MGTIADKLNLLLNTKAAIKSAIIGKGQTVADSDPFSAYSSKIQAIETGVQLPSLSDPAVAGDIASGKETIDADGNVLTGTVREVPSGGYEAFNMSIIDNDHLVQGSLSRIFLYSSPLNADVLFRSGSEVGLYLKQENFGDATADDVRAGKTFTSKAGLKVTGTAEF